MSVSTSDLKSMLSKVRKADHSPSAPPQSSPSPQAPAPAAAAVAVEAPPPPPGVEAAPAPAAAPPPPEPEENYDVESILREINADEELLLRILGMLYRAKKKSPNGGAVGIIPMEKQLGLARESATFVINYMKAKRLIEANDKSANMITVDGIEYLRGKLAK